MSVWYTMRPKFQVLASTSMTVALFNETDHAYMAEAIRLARRGLYTTHPNPRVGCVLVKENQVVGRGWHQLAGQGHAEVNALAQAGEAARGATAYVSLEPCSHHGKTPPCAQALIDAGVARVISAMEDPNPQVAGRGHLCLQEAGVDTITGLMEAEAERVNPGFIKRMTQGLPWVRLKSAMSIDGRIAMASGESQWITGPEARADVQRLRARSAAILSGVGTVLADNPSLTVRPALWPGTSVSDHALSGWGWPAEYEPIQPLRVLVDSLLRIPPNANVFQQPGETLIACVQADAKSQAALEAVGAVVAEIPGPNGRVDLHALLRLLAQREINEVLVEAGGVLAGALLGESLVDEWVCYLAPTVLGSSAQPVLNLPGIDAMSQALPMALQDSRVVGQDIRLTYGWRH